jgi:hypothetical protein
LWWAIDGAFSEPVRASDDKADYSPTQIIAELFKADECDGVSYRSSVEPKGRNFALFDLDAADLGPPELHRVTCVQFEFEKMGF